MRARWARHGVLTLLCASVRPRLCLCARPTSLPAPDALARTLQRCLVHSVGGYEKLPAEIDVLPLESERAVLDAPSRRRWPHLAHLPLGAPADLVEVDLAEAGLLSESTRRAFADELGARAKRRRQRARRDERDDRRRQQEEERARAGPTLTEEDFAPLVTSGVVIEPDFVNDELPEEGALGSSPGSAALGTSFARMTRLGFAADPVPPPTQGGEEGNWPTLGGGASARADGGAPTASPGGWVGGLAATSPPRAIGSWGQGRPPVAAAPPPSHARSPPPVPSTAQAWPSLS